MLTNLKNHRCKFVQSTNGKVKIDAVFDYNIAKKKVLMYKVKYRDITDVYEKPLKDHPL